MSFSTKWGWLAFTTPMVRDICSFAVLWSLYVFVASLVFAWFPLLSACSFTEFRTSVICYVFMHCLGSVLMQNMSPRNCFRGTNYGMYHEHVAYLHHILWGRARLWLKLHASTVCRFLSWLSYLSSYVFLRRRCSFTSRKLYVCLEMFLCFLHIFDWAYVSFLLLFVLTPHDSNVAGYAQVCWLCCMLYMPLFVLSSMTSKICYSTV